MLVLEKALWILGEFCQSASSTCSSLAKCMSIGDVIMLTAQTSITLHCNECCVTCTRVLAVAPQTSVSQLCSSYVCILYVLLPLQALLTHDQADFDYHRIVQVLVRALKDDHSRVVTVAIEALAVVHHMIVDDIQPLLIAAGASVSSRLMLAGRFASKDLPAIKADGAVEHEASGMAIGVLHKVACTGTQCQTPANIAVQGSNVSSDQMGA